MNNVFSPPYVWDAIGDIEREAEDRLIKAEAEQEIREQEKTSDYLRRKNDDIPKALELAK